MLVLTRKSGEQIRIANDITITVLRIQGNSIRIGIEAPRSVPVVRAELPPHEAAEGTASTESLELSAPRSESAVSLPEPSCRKARSPAVPPAPSSLPNGPLSGRVVQRRNHQHDRRRRPQARHSSQPSGFSPASPAVGTTAMQAAPLC